MKLSFAARREIVKWRRFYRADPVAHEAKLDAMQAWNADTRCYQKVAALYLLRRELAGRARPFVGYGNGTGTMQSATFTPRPPEEERT